MHGFFCLRLPFLLHLIVRGRVGFWVSGLEDIHMYFLVLV